MRPVFGLLAALVFSSLAVAAPKTNPMPLQVEVLKSRTGWTADLSFSRPERAWVFVRSPVTEQEKTPWRRQSWTVLTPGVRLERRGFYDVLVAANGGPVPRKVRVGFAPFSKPVVADYAPALVFTDGSTALYSEQFDAFAVASGEAADRLPADLNGVENVDSRTRVTFRDAGGLVLHGGRRQRAASISDDRGSYVLFGPATPVVTPVLTTVIDPQLPAWIRSRLLTSIPDLLARYAADLGPAPGTKPTVMVSWEGPTKGRTSMKGSVLPSLVVMAYEGEGVLKENAAAKHNGLWFFAHESAHFWLGERASYETAYDAWITEGGADLMAIRAVPAVDPTYDWRKVLQREVDDCVKLSAGRPVRSALERNEHRAYYACGAVFGLVAEAASRRPFVRFVDDLLDTYGGDKMITRAEWLGALDKVSGDPTLSRDIGTLLDKGSPEPKKAIASLFTRAGVLHSIAPDGTPQIL